MQGIVLVRHAVAEERENWNDKGKRDDLRPLTEKGLMRLKKSTRGLRTLVPHIDQILSSPYVRTRQTADVLCDHYRISQPEDLGLLEPGGSKDKLLRHLKSVGQGKIVLVVGHEPDLSELLAVLVGLDREFTHFKKAGAAYVAFDSSGAGKLEWFLPPRQLRVLAALDDPR